MSKQATGPDTRTQTRRFIEAAPELGADEDEATFEAKLAVIGRQKRDADKENSSEG